MHQLSESLIICYSITTWPSILGYRPPTIYLEKINGDWEYNRSLSVYEIPEPVITKILQYLKIEVAR
ncbi:hypothetical protein [Segetibacter sp.]|uniref:hypothetical protein n=1 Tax=Segetibacter sp. TaxID=2231182 RepID=UPI0026265EE8|nr:hypothetical protein [Segetibacter sp.]